MQTTDHWNQVYSTHASHAVSWFQTHAEHSLRLIRQTGLPPTAAIIDVGAGASTLVDDLLRQGYSDLSVLDLSAAALQTVQQRLGASADKLHWIEGDVTQLALPAQAYDVWHDRAVFHFLTEPAQRRAYVQAVQRTVKPGGHVIVATFGEEGPEHCSGLPVMRYQPDALHAEFGAPFVLVRHEKELHHTPSGRTQQFVYCYCRKVEQ